MFEIKYLISERDIVDWYKQNDDTLYGYFWFVINNSVIGAPPIDNFPMDFVNENLLEWQRQLLAVAGLKEGESRKCYFCTVNRLNLVFRNIDDLRFEITCLRDNLQDWSILIEKSLVIGEIEKFDKSFNNGISYVMKNRLSDY